MDSITKTLLLQKVYDHILYEILVSALFIFEYIRYILLNLIHSELKLSLDSYTP